MHLFYEIYIKQLAFIHQNIDEMIANCNPEIKDFLINLKQLLSNQEWAPLFKSINLNSKFEPRNNSDLVLECLGPLMAHQCQRCLVKMLLQENTDPV